MSTATATMSEYGISDQRVESLQDLWHSLALVCTAWRPRGNHMAADYGVSSPQFIVFPVLIAGEPLTMGQIGDRSKLPTWSLTTLVDRLGELGLARRKTQPSDRRTIQVKLTESGHDLARQIAADTMQATAQITASLTDHQIDETTGVVRHLLVGNHQYIPMAGRVQVHAPSLRASIGQLSHRDLGSPLPRDGSPSLEGRTLTTIRRLLGPTASPIPKVPIRASTSA